MSSASTIDTTWHHIVVTRSGKIGKIYIDGKLDNTQKLHHSWNPAPDTETIIGGTCWGYFDGIIDELKVYNRVLSAEEINASYEMGQK